MGDRLQQFIRDNRESFDAEDPDPRVLKKLKKRLFTGRNKAVRAAKVFAWAAVIACFITLSVLLYFSESKKNELMNAAKAPVNSERITGIPDPVYAGRMHFFQDQIDLRQAALKEVKNEQPELYKRFINDVKQLDSAFHALKTELDNSPNKEVLLQAMIRNLELQADLLNRQLLIIKAIKQKTNNHEEVTI